MVRSDQETKEIIEFLIKNDMVGTYYDPKKKEQMIEITQFGKEINEILDHMRKTDNV